MCSHRTMAARLQHVGRLTPRTLCTQINPHTKFGRLVSSLISSVHPWNRIKPGCTNLYNSFITVRTNSGYSNKTVNIMNPLFLQAEKFGERIALVDQHGYHQYNDLLYHTDNLTDKICDILEAKCELSSELITI